MVNWFEGLLHLIQGWATHLNDGEGATIFYQRYEGDTSHCSLKQTCTKMPFLYSSVLYSTVWGSSLCFLKEPQKMKNKVCVSLAPLYGEPIIMSTNPRLLQLDVKLWREAWDKHYTAFHHMSNFYLVVSSIAWVLQCDQVVKKVELQNRNSWNIKWAVMFRNKSRG